MKFFRTSQLENQKERKKEMSCLHGTDVIVEVNYDCVCDKRLFFFIQMFPVVRQQNK